MNVCIFSGNISRVDELKEGATPYIKFGVAVNKKQKDDSKAADFVNFTAFGKTAEFIGKYCQKGNKVTVQSHYAPGSYTNKEGKTVYTHDFIVDSIERQERAELNKPADDGFKDVKPDELKDEGLPFF